MKKEYAQILKLINKHKDSIVFDVSYLKSQAENHLFGLELRDTYGLDIDPKKVKSTEWHKLNDFCHIGLFGEKYGRLISYPDFKGQPKNELLLHICFPTGAYIFGEDYPTVLFNKFWDELKSFKPKYIDTMNHVLYFDLPNSKDVFNNFNSIIKKYYDINIQDIKLRRIAKMEQDLATLKNSSL